MRAHTYARAEQTNQTRVTRVTSRPPMTTKNIPTWLETKLIHNGVMTSDRVTKHAKPRHCPTCGLITLVGLDDLLPKTIHADLLPTTTTGEAHALLTGKRTFGNDNGQLYERRAGQITLHPADNWRTHTEHQCGTPPLPINTQFTPTPPTNQERPPF